MVKTTDVRNSSKEHDLFWEAYRGCAEENRVRTDRSPFYVRWAKDFDSFLQDKSLKDRSRKDIEAFLADLGKRPSIGARTVGTRQCRDHHDLYPRTEQARAFSEEPSGYLKKVKSNYIVQTSRTIQPQSYWDGKTLSKRDGGVKIFKGDF